MACIEPLQAAIEFGSKKCCMLTTGGTYSVRLLHLSKSLLRWQSQSMLLCAGRYLFSWHIGLADLRSVCQRSFEHSGIDDGSHIW